MTNVRPRRRTTIAPSFLASDRSEFLIFMVWSFLTLRETVSSTVAFPVRPGPYRLGGWPVSS
jgi:hypothetical protein